MYDVFLDILALPDGVLTSEVQNQIIQAALVLIIILTIVFVDMFRSLFRQFRR